MVESHLPRSGHAEKTKPVFRKNVPQSIRYGHIIWRSEISKGIQDQYIFSMRLNLLIVPAAGCMIDLNAELV